MRVRGGARPCLVPLCRPTLLVRWNLCSVLAALFVPSARASLCACPFLQVEASDAASFATVDKIAAMVKSGQNTRIDRIVQAD